MTISVDEKSFEKEVLKASGPVVVDFWAEWCGPCKAIAPALEELSKEMAGKVKITKLNIDDNQKLAEKYNIRAIPTLMVFKDGKVVSEQRGAAPKKRLEDWINKAIV